MNKAIKMWLARAFFTIAALCVLGMTWAAYRGVTFVVTSGQKPAEDAPQEHTPNTEKTIQIAEELAARVESHGKLPARSPLARMGFGQWSPDQPTNTAAMQDLLETLVCEIGSNKALGAIRTLRENRKEEEILQSYMRSNDPAVLEQASSALKKNREDAATLEEIVQQNLSREGFAFTREQIKALCASPNAEDTASMISAFGTLKVVVAEMETRLRARPSQEHAQRYYGAHTVLLLALDKLQKTAATRIVEEHIPQVMKIAQEAYDTGMKAKSILEDDLEHDLSPNERTALTWNIQSCKKTVEMSARTEEKLQKNLEILRKANKKLEKSIATAKNCHMTAMLQKEILTIESSGSMEIAKIEALTIPELAAVNFADPENPTMSAERKPLR